MTRSFRTFFQNTVFWTKKIGILSKNLGTFDENFRVFRKI